MKLTPDRFQISEFARTVFAVTVPSGTRFEEVLEESFWAHVSSKMRPRDRIEILTEDCTWFAELFITAASANWAKVSVLRFVELNETPVAPTIATEDGFSVRWGGPKNKFQVVRSSDKEIVVSGIETKPLAQDWITAHETSHLV